MSQTEKDEPRERACKEPERQDSIHDTHTAATGEPEKGAQGLGSQQPAKSERDDAPAGSQPDNPEAVVDTPEKMGKLQLVLVILGMLETCFFRCGFFFFLAI